MGIEYGYILAAATPASALRLPGERLLVDVGDDGLLDSEAMSRVRDWGDLDVFEASEHGEGRRSGLWIGRVLWRSEFADPSQPQMSGGFTLDELDHAVVDVKAALARYGDVDVRIVILESGF